MSKYDFDWSDLAFGSKTPVNSLRAIFIAAPREMSQERFKQLVKEYLPQGNVVLGQTDEPHVLGLEGQPQFKMLSRESVQPIIDKVNRSSAKHKIYTLKYLQRDIKHILEKLEFKKVVLVNGSWYRAFHLRPEYYALARKRVLCSMVSPFASEQEAKDYLDTVKLPGVVTTGTFEDTGMLGLVSRVAQLSFDYSGFQIGAVLGKKKGRKFEILHTAHNKIVPYETYAMHHGASREKNFSPMHDQNYYDTVHAEQLLLIETLKQGIRLDGTSLFVNLLPCPNCSRMLTQTDISEVIYAADHSEGYAVRMLEGAGKIVRRLV